MILALIAGSPAFGADVIHKGVDLWMTVAGFAQTSFADQPIPAGFFCEGSQPFTGKVVFKGAPLAIAPAKSLGPIDTAVRRLDDASVRRQGRGDDPHPVAGAVAGEHQADRDELRQV